MVGRILTASVLSAVLMFMWGFFFWGLADMGSKLMEPLPAEEDVTAVLRSKRTPTGMYVYPMPVDPSQEDAHAEWERKHEEGPILQMAYRAEGGPVMSPAVMGKGLGHYFVVALLTSILLSLIVDRFPSYAGRVGFVLLVGLISAVWANGGDAVWWFHSLQYSLGNSAYTLGAALVMGLATAAIIKPKPA